ASPPPTPRRRSPISSPPTTAATSAEERSSTISSNRCSAVAPISSQTPPAATSPRSAMRSPSASASPRPSRRWAPSPRDRRAARLAARLSHPNIVPTYEVGESGGNYFMAMEYLSGQPFGSVLKRARPGGGLSFGMAARVVADLCAGLHYAHQLKDFDGNPLHV